MFSVWQRPRVVWGGGDEGGSGGGGSDKTYNSLSEAARDGQHGKAVNIKGKGRQKVEFADKSYDKKMSTASSKASTGGSSGGYTSLADMFDGGGPGKSGAVSGSGGGARADTNNDGYVSAAEARANPLDQNIFSAVGNYVRSGGIVGAAARALSGGGGSSAPRPPRQRIGTKGMTSAQRKALTDAGYEVTKGGSVKKDGGTVAGLNFSGSQRVNDIMNSGSLSGEASSFGDAFAEARRKAGGDGGTFTYGGKQFTTNIDRAPKTSLRPQLRPDTVAPAAAPIVDYDRLAEQYGAYGAGRASPQAANFYTDPSASTAAVYPQAPDFSQQGLPPGSYEVASSGNAFEKFLNTDGPIGDIIPDLGSDPSDNREPRGMYDSPSIVLPDELIGAPMGYVPEPMTYQEILEGAGAEITPEARTAPLSDYDAAQALLTGDAGGRLKPGFSQPLQARIDTPEEDAIERARLQARVGAGIGTISPEVERNAASNVRLQNLRRYAEQQRDPEPPGLSTAELLAAGAAQGASIMSRAAQDATNVIAPPDMLDDGADFIGPFRPGMEPKAGVPMVVGQQSKVATEAAIAAEGASNVFNRVKNNMDRDTRAAIERRIFPDGIGSFDSEAAKAQFVMQGASMFPIVAAMVANPKLGMTVAGGATIADVGQQIDANVDARYKAGELGRLNPSQVQAIKLLAREKAAVPSAVVGGTVARFLGTNPISGIVADVISEVGLEPTIAETTTALASNTAIKPEEFVADRAGDVAFLSAGTSGLIAPAAVAGQAMNTASAPPVVQTEAPTQDSLAYKAGQGLGSFTPPKAFSDAATLTATTMGGTPRMPSAVAPDAAAKVISGSGSSVAPAPAAQTVAPVQTLPENLSGLGQQGGIPSLLASSGLTPGPSMVSPTALSVGNNAQYTTPSFVPDGTAALQAATIEDTGTGVTVDAPTPLTPEQIANVSPQAGAELDAALDKAKLSKPDSSVGAMDNKLRSALTQDLLRRDPNYSSYNELFFDQLNQKLKDTDQNLSALPPDPRALELAQLNRDGPLQTGGVPRTYPTTGIDSLSPLANQLYTPEQRANMQRDRQIANAQREKARLEAEAMRPLETAQNAILNSQSNVSAAENEVALANQLANQMEQLQAVNEVIAAGKTPLPVNLPATPEFTTPQTKAQLAALTTPVEAPAMAPLVRAASPESAPTDVDPTLNVAQQLRQDDLIDALAEAQQAPVDPSPDFLFPEDVDIEGVMSLVNQKNVPDQQPLVLTDPVEAQAITDVGGGITTALPGRIPKDKLTTRFDSNLPIDSPFSRENQLARYAERRAKALAAAKDKTAPVGSTEVISRTDEEIARENQIEQDRINARNAALKGIASIPATRTTIVDEPRDLIEEQTLPDELLTEPFNNTPPEDTGGEGTGTDTPRESAPKYVPVDMNNENNDALGCPSGYARVFDPATGQPICGRIDEPSVAESSDPAEEAEEDGVVIDIPATERPKISPYYVPEMIESNYTPYVPGRRARIFKDVAVRD